MRPELEEYGQYHAWILMMLLKQAEQTTLPRMPQEITMWPPFETDGPCFEPSPIATTPRHDWMFNRLYLLSTIYPLILHTHVFLATLHDTRHFSRLSGLLVG